MANFKQQGSALAKPCGNSIHTTSFAKPFLLSKVVGKPKSEAWHVVSVQNILLSWFGSGVRNIYMSYATSRVHLFVNPFIFWSGIFLILVSHRPRNVQEFRR